MIQHSSGSAILADRHLRLSEGVRGLLESSFGTVYVVADTESLLEGTRRLAPALIVLDFALAGADIVGLLERLRAASPQSRQIVLTVHDLPTVARMALTARADSVVLKRCIGRDLLPAIDSVLGGEVFVSPEFGFNGSDA